MSSHLQGLLALCVTEDASDLHLTSGTPPVLRQRGELRMLNQAPVSAQNLAQWLRQMLTDEQWSRLQRDRGLDMAHEVPVSPEDEAPVRFRLNVYFERGELALAARRLNNVIRSFADLHLPQELSRLRDHNDGLVLVTGPTGSGKSTTLATLIEEINRHRACHILTVEDPVEYLFQNRRSLVHQREVGRDVKSFADAVRAALREDPDVMLVGEMRDLETMRAAVTAAETGHLVFSTVHSGDPIGAVDRIIGAFPAEEQNYLRQQLSLVLRAVITQHLLPRKGQRGRVPVVEVLQVTSAVASLIRQNKPRQVLSLMEAGATQGMRTLEQSLVSLVADNLVELDAARLLARDEAQFERLLGMRKPDLSAPRHKGGDAWR
ncbi:MAG: type IV pilus twitching motility protein PilT [Aquabacterium sp.]